MEQQEQDLQKASARASKANQTSGPEERSRKAKMAIWTRTHGKDDEKNPFSFQNYYTPAEQIAVRAAIAHRSSTEYRARDAEPTTFPDHGRETAGR
jgi:hypothetical protein